MRDRYIQDTRIHCALYFIAPSGQSLKPIDIIVMKKLSEVVNVVPVIAKSDSLTLEERELFKQRVRVSFQALSKWAIGLTAWLDPSGTRTPQYPNVPL
jgi:septin family protein